MRIRLGWMISLVLALGMLSIIPVAAQEGPTYEVVSGTETFFIPMAPTLQVNPNYHTSIEITDVTGGAAVVGSTFTTDLKLTVSNQSPSTVGIRSVDVWIGFDPTVVDIVEVKPVQDFFGSAMFVVRNEVLSGAACPSGFAKCIHLVLTHTGAPILNRSGRIATLTWKGLAEGNAGLQIDRTSSFLSDENGCTVPVNTVSVPNLNISGAGIICGVVLRQGARCADWNCTGTSLPNANTLVIAYTVAGMRIGDDLTDANGAFCIEVPLGSTYMVEALYPGYLRARRGNVAVVGGTVDLGTVTLLGGDVNGDNNVNILDLVIIVNDYGMTIPPAAAVNHPLDPVDINDDLKIDIYDLSIASGNFGRVAPLTW